MDWVLLAGLLLALWWLWDIRRTLGLRARPALPHRAPAPTVVRANFPGAVRPNRFVVVRWPDGLLFYEGSVGAAARDVFTKNHPAPGQEFELWELGDRRGHKAG